MIRVLIVDDERPARDGLRLRIESAEGFEVVGEAANGKDAIAAILEHRPDVVFLDIRMPDLNGFEVLRGVPRSRRPRVIFVTAYDRHALEAFDVHALDYVVKPIVPRRLEAALARARIAHEQHLATRTLERLASTLRGLPDLASATSPSGILDRLTVREGSRMRIVPVSSIRWVEACGNYVTLHTESRELLHRVALTRLARQLPPRAFARVHRRMLVNVSEIAEIRRSPHGDGDILLRDGTVLRMSRRYREALE